MKRIIEYKKEYNALLERSKNAELFFENKEIPFDKKEQMRPQYIEIIKQMDDLMKKIIFYSKDEILNGFDLNKT